MRSVCKFVGRELTGLERDAAGLPHSRRWRLCLHENKPIGEFVCSCGAQPSNKRCGQACPGFTPTESQIKKRNRYDGKLHDGLIAALSKTKPDQYFGGGMGNGVLYVGGGKYWPGIVVGVKLLREHGYSGPIEVWHRGSIEPVNERDVAGLFVDIVDTLEVAQRYGEDVSYIQTSKGNHGGWAAKSYALTYTNLDRVLYLDADAYCVDDPTPMFELLHKYSFAFWSDLAHQSRSLRWHMVYPEHNGSGIPPVQGGQLLIDRKNAWKMLSAFHYICQNGEHYWQAGTRRTMYGDQDAWRIGMAAKVCTYVQIDRAHWDRVAFVCRHQNKPMIVHRCQSKLFTPQYVPERNQKYAAPHVTLPLENRVFELFAEQCGLSGVSSIETFNHIYNRNLWGGGEKEGRSGGGSTLRQGQLYIDIVNTLLLTNSNINSIVDLGCGDGLLGSHLKVLKYVGVDASDIILDTCRSKYPRNVYVHCDFAKTLSDVPPGDMLLCKDVFHHWPTEMIVKFLEELESNNRWKMWVFCCDDRENGVSNCHLGGYRPIRLDKGVLERFKLKRRSDIHQKGLYIRSF